MSQVKRRGRKAAAKEGYFEEEQESAVKRYLALGRDSRITRRLLEMLRSHDEIELYRYDEEFGNLIYLLRLQRVKNLAKAESKAEFYAAKKPLREELAKLKKEKKLETEEAQLLAKQVKRKFDDKKWEAAYGWVHPSELDDLTDVIDQDVFRILEIPDEQFLITDFDECSAITDQFAVFVQLLEIERNALFQDIIDEALRKLIDGILAMPKFQKILGISKDVLIEETYYHLLFQMDKFVITEIGKGGKQVKAFSYYGTIVKNYILGRKIELDKRIGQHGTVLDVTAITDLGQEDKYTQKDFEELLKSVIAELDRIMANKRMNKNDLVVGNSLKYMLLNWHKIEFQNKQEFMRLLAQYCQLPQTIVARSFKKFKVAVFDKFLSRSEPNNENTRDN